MRPALPLLAAALLAPALAGCWREAWPEDPKMIAPFSDPSEFGPVNEAFSATGAAPWGFAHDGIDFFPLADGTPLRAAAAGAVSERTLGRNPTSQNWQVNLAVVYDDHYTVEYVFEPFSAVTADGEAQLAAVLLAPGTTVVPGDPIGSVKVAGSGAHLHFGLKKDEAWICPEPYFTEEGATAVLDLIHRDHPTWAMCY
jgi:murein DD-endopeptidase MepM/ murein hydrolase activator NlpD